MAKQTICLVGRPNTGKSTLFNRIVGRKVAIIEDAPGVTRDRIYSQASFNEKPFYLIDTGGIDLTEGDFNEEIRMQVEVGIEEADTIIFVVDAKDGVTTSDELIRDMLKKQNKKVIVAINKIDNKTGQDNAYEFYTLGFDEYVGISAEHGTGVNELLKIHQDSIMLDQFNNPSNALAHYLTTGKEIYLDLNGKVDIFVAGIGTGGTITGTSKYLKEQNKNIKVIGVEPDSSPLLTKGKVGPHKIQGIGPNFIPSILDQNLIDAFTTIKDLDAFKYSKELLEVEGIFIGLSSGAAFYASLLEAQKEENKDKNIVVILPDTGNRYLSIFN